MNLCAKGSGVVVMDKPECLRLLSEPSINDVAKFRVVDPERPIQLQLRISK